MFGKHWTPARATVVASRIASTTGDGMVSISEFVVDVRTPEGELFRAKLEEPRIATNFKPPSVGVEIGVEYDPKSRDVRFDKDDPTISWKAYKKGRQDSFEETLAQPPGSPVPAPSDTTPFDTTPFGTVPSGTVQFGTAAGADNPAMTQIQELFKSAAANGGVVRLDSSDPEAAKLKQFLLGAIAEQTGPPPASPEPSPPTSPLE